jgi:MFS family permease
VTGTRSTLRLSSLGGFTVSLDTAVNVGLPAISLAFGVSPREVAWIVICYLVPVAVTTVVGGMLGDRFGHRRVFGTGAWLSLLAFPLCSFAPSFGSLLAARGLQGISAGLVGGTSPALVTLAVGVGERSRALGILNFAMGAAAAGAPLLAGPMIDAWGWRSVFLFRVPVAAALVAATLVSSDPSRASVAAGPRTAAGPLAIPRAATLGGILAFLANGAAFVMFVLAPHYLVQALGISASVAGIIFALFPTLSAVAALVSGRLAARLDPLVLVACGLSIEVGGLVLTGVLNEASSLAAVSLSFALVGAGVGAFSVPNMTIVMAALPNPRQGLAGGLVTGMQRLGMISAATLTPWLFEFRREMHAAAPACARGCGEVELFVRGFSDAVTASVLVCGVALALAVALHRPRRTRGGLMTPRGPAP